jgi:hypothetical protein
MKKKKEQEFHFAIGFNWPSGSVGFCSFHSSEIQYGNTKDALATLKYAKTNFGKDHKYRIYKLVLEEMPA